MSKNGTTLPATPEETLVDNHEAIEQAVREILLHVGEDPDREGLLRTPNRIARMFDEVLAGYTVDPVALVNDALFNVEYDEMIVVKDIEFFSMCEHHMLPFFGRAHVAYIPQDKVIGLSKIPRICRTGPGSLVDGSGRRPCILARRRARSAFLLE